MPPTRPSLTFATAQRLAPAPQVNMSDSDSKESDIDGMQGHKPDIDERSKDEDNHAAHKLLREMPAVMQATTGDPPVPKLMHEIPAATQALTGDPPVLSYNHDGFSVSPWRFS